MTIGDKVIFRGLKEFPLSGIMKYNNEQAVVTEVRHDDIRVEFINPALQQSQWAETCDNTGWWFPSRVVEKV